MSTIETIKRPAANDFNRAAYFEAVYTPHYVNHKSDSPEASKASLLRRAMSMGAELTRDDTVIDIGSGRQVFLMRFAKALKSSGFEVPHLVSVDIAEINSQGLPGRFSPRVSHIRANGEKLPLPDNYAAALTSNMGLECMGEEALAETYRVLRPDGKLVANIFEKSMIQDQDEGMRPRPGEGQTAREETRFTKTMENSPLLTNPDQIVEKFARNGLEIINLVAVVTRRYSWIEVDAVKSVTLKLIADWARLAEQIDHTTPYNIYRPAVDSGARYQTEYDWVLGQRKKEIRVLEIEAQLAEYPEIRTRLLEFKKHLTKLQRKDKSIKRELEGGSKT